MSRTRKDVPYWVRLNRDGIFTDHDHSRLGKTYYRSVAVRDQDNNPIYETIPVFLPATKVLENRWGASDKYFILDSNGNNVAWLDSSIKTNLYVNKAQFSFGSFIEPVIRRAHILVNKGHGGTLVEVGTATRIKRERVVWQRTPDHCTEGVKLIGRHWWADYTVPCKPELPRSEQRWWQYGPTAARASEHEAYYSYERTRQRALAQNIKKRWNSGDDIEDWDEDDNYNGTRRSYVYW